jgi:hypothetical protein
MGAGGKPTRSVAEFYKQWMAFMGPEFDVLPGTNEMVSGNNLPIHKRKNEVELMVVERYFPEKLMLRGILRDSLDGYSTPQRGYAHILSNSPVTTVIPSDVMPLNDGGTTETDPETGWSSYVPANIYVGAVQAIKGNVNNDFVFMGYWYGYDDGDLSFPAE